MLMPDTIEERVLALESQVRVLEKTISIDRFKAEQEKTRRTAKEQQTKAARLTIRVSRGADGVLLLAELISDPVKFNQLVRKSIISKIIHVKSPNRDKWIVSMAAADGAGVLLKEVI